MFNINTININTHTCVCVCVKIIENKIDKFVQFALLNSNTITLLSIWILFSTNFKRQK